MLIPTLIRNALMGVTLATCLGCTAGAPPPGSPFSDDVHPPVVGPTGVTSYTQRSYLPNHPDGVPTTVQWVHGATLVLADNQGADLLAFLRGTQSLHAATSRDAGVSWQWVTPSALVPVDPPLVIAQGDDGDVHLVSWSWANGVSYARLALTRDTGGHLADFGAVAASIPFPSAPTTGDISADLVAGTDQQGNPTLFYAIYDDYGPNGGRVVAGKTRVHVSGHPALTADFVALDEGPGFSQLEVVSTSNPWAAPHNAGVFMAQHPISRDLWFQWGPLNTGDGLTSNAFPLRRARAVPAGPHAFALEDATTAAEYAGGYGVQNYAVVSSGVSVWFMYGTPTSAINFDTASASGVVTRQVVPSPYGGARSGGFFSMAVSSSEANLWVAGQVGEDIGDHTVVPAARWAKHWDGVRWTTFGDTHLGNELFRVARSGGWEQGLVILQSRFDYASWRPALGTLRTVSE